MSTTSLYVELIIIGMEAVMWIASLSIYFTDIKYISIIAKISEKLPASLFLAGVMYILGLVIDRISDLAFTKMESRIRKNVGLKAKSSILIWKESNQEEYFKFTRSKIRILRSSIINIPIIMISVALNILKYYQQGCALFLFVLIVGIILSCFTWMGYKQTVRNFYNKAIVLEEMIEEKR